MAIDKQSTYTELRYSTFNLFLGSVGLAAATLLWLGNVGARSSSIEIVILCGMVEAICAVSWWVRGRNFQVAIAFAIGGLWLCNAYSVSSLHEPLFLFLFSLISMITSVLANRRTALLVTILSTVFIAIYGSPRLSQEALLLPILLTWFTLFTTYIAFNSLYQALDMAWSYQEYAIQQMSQAREHRANLMQTTKALNEVRQDLERANTQLRHANRVAEEARRLKAQFAANVSHELRTPINLIVGFSETIVLAPEAYGTPLPPVYWADMHTIHRSAKHLQSLINDVLDVSQIEAGKMAVVKEEINPRQVISEAGNLAREWIESRGLTFKVALPDEMPTMYLDRTRIRQVILNLLSNAARFTDQGRIELSAQVNPSHLVVSVKDTGIGIPPDDLKRVFEEFHQVEGSLSRKQSGTGLGLTLSKQFVEMHGGSIWSESQGIPGLGTTFMFTLPLMNVSSSFHPTTESVLEPDAGKSSYFVVLDDDPAILQLFERHTNRHHAIGVSSEEEALRMVETVRPAALVVGESTGFGRITDTLRSQNNQTPVITCAMPSGTRRAQIPDKQIHLVRPVTSDTMRETLDRIGSHIRSVLVMAEDHDTMRMLSRMLEAMPRRFRLWKAYSSEEALALMLQQDPDVVILDSLTPDTQGLTVVQHMHSNPSLAEIPVILAPASGEADELTPATEGRIVICKTSGFEPMELVRCVERLVDGFSPANVPALLENLTG